MSEAQPQVALRGRYLVRVTDAEFKESQHPRKKDGKFAPLGGGSNLSWNQYVVGHGVNNLLKDKGWAKNKFLTKKHGVHVFTKGNNDLVIKVHPPEHGKSSSVYWELHDKMTGATVSKGKGIGWGLTSALVQAELQKPAAAPKPGAAPQQDPIAKSVEKFKQEHLGPFTEFLMANKGFKLGDQVDKDLEHIARYEKGDKTIIVKVDQFNGKTTWTSYSPGNVTKTGEGLDALKALMSGAKPSGALTWTNVPGNPAAPVSAAQALQMEAQKAKAAEELKQQSAKQQAEMAKKLAEQQAKQDKMFALAKKLKSQTPEPNSIEKSALSNYTGSGYKSLNDCLRHEKNCSHYTSIPGLESFLKKAALKEPVTVYRSVSGEYAKILKSVLADGARFIDRGFMSTTINEDMSFHHGLRFQIELPAGTQAAYVEQYSQHANEKELIVQRGSHMVVKKFDRDNNMVHVELVPHSETHKAAA